VNRLVAEKRSEEKLDISLSTPFSEQKNVAFTLSYLADLGDQIDLTRTCARGACDLKYFLEYAERPKSIRI